MKITSLEVKDFRLFKSQSFDFGGRPLALADNYKGKSTLKAAITFGLFGVTPTGSNQTDEYIRTGAKKAEVTLKGEFADGEHEIVRIKGTRKSEIYLDGQKASQNDIDMLIGHKERFLSVFALGYFTSLADRDARNMTMNLIKPPTQEEVLAQLADEERALLKGESLRDPDELAKEKRAALKASEAEANKTEGRIETLQEQVSKEIPESKQFDETELRSLKEKLKAASTDNGAQINRLQSELNSLGREYKAFKSQMKAIPGAPYSIGGDCPVCAREFDDESLTHALGTYSEEAKQIHVSNEKLIQKCTELYERGNAVKEELGKLQAAEATKQPTDDIEAKIAELEQQKAEVTSHNGYVNRLRLDQLEAKDSLEKAQMYLKSLVEEQTQYNAQIAAIGKYRAKLADMQVSQLKQHLNRVDIQLFKIAKTTGEVKDTFTVTYDGKPYKSLSHSEQMRADMEIATLFNKVVGYDYPVFLDDAESITHFDEPYASQLFRAKVVEGQELKVVSDSQESERGVA